MSQSLAVSCVKLLVVDLIGGIFGFPVWWYGRGLKQTARGLWRLLGSYRTTLAVGVWIKNLFVPMYGIHDIGGRLVSFFMRAAMIVFRSIALYFVSVFFLILFLVYLVLPIVAVALLIYNAFSVLLEYGR